MKMNRACYATGLAVAILFGAASAAWAQAPGYPNRPVRIIVPLTPGGGTDTIARGLAQRLNTLWGQQVVVENRPGAGTIVGAEAAAKAPADGYTLLFTEPATFVISPHLYKKLPYDPLGDFAPITVVCRLSPVLALGNHIPAKNIAELIAYAKANPGKLSYGSFGSGSYPHVSMEHFKKLTGTDLLHVPYKGSVGAIADIMGGQLSMLLINISVFEQHERAGKLRIVAAATKQRLALRPDLPTIEESGVPGFSVSVWFGMAAPAATPVPILDKIHADVLKVLADAEFREKFLRPQSVEPGGNSRAEFVAQLKSEFELWRQLVRDSGAKQE